MSRAMQLAWGSLALAVLWSFRLARAAVALVGLAAWLGDPWALLIIGLAAAARLHWVLRVAAFLTLALLWRWPWWLALLLTVPRLLLVLPGLVNAVVARLRHPRPRWPALAVQGALATADTEPRPRAAGAAS